MTTRNLLSERLYGPPCTGKTTTLLNLVESYLAAGIKPNEIAYLAFTVKAAHEAMDRAARKFDLGEDAFPHFRTIHSLAFRTLGLTTSQVVKKKHYSELCERLGYEFSGYIDLDEGQTATALLGDRLIFMEGLAKARMVTREQQFDEYREDISWFEFSHFCETYQKYKESKFLIDFNDMLETFGQTDLPGFKVLIVDEAQDLSNLQWEIIDGIAERSENVHYAGDDDQAIFRWAGANPGRFVRRAARDRILEQSYRVPREVHALAERIIGEVADRPAKVYRPRDAQGRIETVNRAEELPLESGDWLILARNSYLLKEVQERCLRDGLGYVGKAGKLYVPEDYPPDRAPNVRISTIHGAKGAEAQNVAVFSDVSLKTYNAMQGELADELRTFYVAVTRSKENLWIIDPQSNNYVEFLHS